MCVTDLIRIRIWCRHGGERIHTARVIRIPGVPPVVSFLKVIVSVRLEHRDPIVVAIQRPALLAWIALRVVTGRVVDMKYHEPAMGYVGLESRRLPVLDKQIFIRREVFIDAIGHRCGFQLVQRVGSRRIQQRCRHPTEPDFAPRTVMRWMILCEIESPAICHQPPRAYPFPGRAVGVVEIRQSQKMARLVTHHANTQDVLTACCPQSRLRMIIEHLDPFGAGPAGRRDLP